MPRARDGGPEYAVGGRADDNDFIEMGPSRVASRPPNVSRNSDRNGRTGGVSQHFFGLVLPTPTPTPLHSHTPTADSRLSHSRRTTQNPPPPPSRASRQPPQQEDHALIIDLTQDPDSPPEREQHIRNGRNPRRTNSQRMSPPRLSRSDSTSVGQDVSVIDLTADSPEATRIPNLEEHRNRQRSRPAPGPIFSDELIQLELFSRGPQLTTRLTNIFSGLLGSRHVSVTRNYEPVRPSSPKPPMEPRPPTREGFTRDTCANPDEDLAVICPCCNDELAYDPNDSTISTTGSRKRKRAPGDHHFWALKNCGHVYCGECFENRRPSKASPLGAGFRIPPGKSSAPHPNDIRCVVEGCDSKAAAKTEWVGIFL